jgi:hypothetical protein
MENISIDKLIEEGREIQNGLTYVEPGYEIIRMFDVYKLSDRNKYFNWKECVIRFLKKYCNGEEERFIRYADKFENKQHYLPQYISNMVGILEACKAVPSKELEQLSHVKTIESELDSLKKLERNYLNYVRSKNDELNSIEAIEAFHKWHATASVLFDRYFYSTDKDFLNFQDIDGSGNGYVLKHEYNNIYTSYQKLLCRIKENRNIKGVLSNNLNSTISRQKKTDEINIFISYSHADKMWLERLEKHLKILKRYFSDIEYWDDTKINGGDKWKQEIEKAIKKANVAILLVSTDFLASDFVTSDEIPPLLRKAGEEGTRILPLIVSPCAYTISELNEFQAINDPNMTLSDLRGDEAAIERVYLDLINSIRGLID